MNILNEILQTLYVASMSSIKIVVSFVIATCLVRFVL